MLGGGGRAAGEAGEVEAGPNQRSRSPRLSLAPNLGISGWLAARRSPPHRRRRRRCLPASRPIPPALRDPRASPRHCSQGRPVNFHRQPDVNHLPKQG